MQIVYQSSAYAPELVTGHYVRCSGKSGAYVFRVFECSTGMNGKDGYGPTLREYDCDGEILPSELREKCIASKQMEKWK